MIGHPAVGHVINPIEALDHSPGRAFILLLHCKKTDALFHSSYHAASHTSAGRRLRINLQVRLQHILQQHAMGIKERTVERNRVAHDIEIIISVVAKERQMLRFLLRG
jgi:hypothetical protein